MPHLDPIGEKYIVRLSNKTQWAVAGMWTEKVKTTEACCSHDVHQSFGVEWDGWKKQSRSSNNMNKARVYMSCVSELQVAVDSAHNYVLTLQFYRAWVTNSVKKAKLK